MSQTPRGYDPEHHRRRKLRLIDYDYSQVGAYFVTICSHDRRCLSGEIRENLLINELGEVLEQVWAGLVEHYVYVRVAEFVVMPNHFHGIIILENESWGGLQSRPPSQPAPHFFPNNAAKPAKWALATFCCCSARPGPG